MKVFALKNCDTCRKALKEMREAGLEPDVTDIRADGLETEDIATIVAAVGFQKALNRRSTTWRALDDPSKEGIDDVKAVQMIVAHPTLLKRPAITDGDTVTVGWDASAKTTWLPD